MNPQSWRPPKGRVRFKGVTISAYKGDRGNQSLAGPPNPKYVLGATSILLETSLSMGQFERGPAQSVKFGTRILTEAHINPLSGDLPKVGLVLRGQRSRKVI